MSVAVLLLGVLGFFVRRPFGFRLVFATLVAAGALALLAILWKKERSLLVWTALVVGVLAGLFVGGEFLFPH